MATKTSKRIPKLTEKVIAATKLLQPQTRKSRNTGKQPQLPPTQITEKILAQYDKAVKFQEKPQRTYEKQMKLYEKQIKLSEKQIKLNEKQIKLIEKHNNKKPDKALSPKTQKVENGKSEKTISPQKTPKILLEDINEIEKPSPVKELKKKLELLRQNIEYYPNKLKRKFSAKKILLKPQHTFKLVAGTNKRKMTTPHKDIKSPLASKKIKLEPGTPPRSSTPELTIQEMVEIMDDDSLNDEDFLEILTCPSPVWWEDPPDDGNVYFEDPISTRSPTMQESPVKTSLENNRNSLKTNNKIEINRKDEKYVKKKQTLENILGNIKNKTGNTKQIKTDKKQSMDNENSDKSTVFIHSDHKEPSNYERNSISNSDISGGISVNSERISENSERISENSEKISVDSAKISVDSEKISVDSERISKNLERNSENSERNSENSEKNSENSESNSENSERTSERISVSESDEYLDLSFNEEEIINTLENIEIPIEKPDTSKIKLENTVVNKVENDSDVIERKEENLKVPDKMPRLTRRPDIRVEIPIFSEDTISDSNVQFISDDDAVEETKTINFKKLEENTKLDSKNDCFYVRNTSKTNESSKTLESDQNSEISESFFRNKKTKDIADFITVYKIIPENHYNNLNSNEMDKLSENCNKNKVDVFSGKLNDFFKKRKNCKRLLTVAGDYKKNVTENIDAKTVKSIDIKNRLNSCDCSVEKNKNGIVDISCDKCNLAPTLTCNSCNFLAASSEVLNKHISNCKHVDRKSNSTLNPISQCLNET